MTDPGRKPTVSNIEILRQFMLADAPFLHPTELTERLEMSRQGVYNRLTDLEDRGLLKSKKEGGARNFWITTEGRSYVTEQTE